MGEANRFPRTRCILKQDIQLTAGSGFEITERASLSIIEHSVVVETSLSSLQDEGSACLLGEADRPVSHCSIGTMLIQGITMSEVRERERERASRRVTTFVRSTIAFLRNTTVIRVVGLFSARAPIDKFPPYVRKRKRKEEFPFS